VYLFENLCGSQDSPCAKGLNLKTFHEAIKLIFFNFPHKTASMFAYKIVKQINLDLGISLWSANEKSESSSPLGEFLAKLQTTDTEVLVGLQRSFNIPKEARGLSSEIYSVTQTCDPLDIITSQYFFHGWIHGTNDKTDSNFLQIRAKLRAGELSVLEYAF
jgi:hypothetical protein